MTITCHRLMAHALRWLAGLTLGAALTGAALAQPAQQPLISRDGGGVKPNIMLTLDDSGSMMFQHMPENTIYVDNFSTASPVGGNSVRMVPSDPLFLSTHYIGLIAATKGSTNYRQKLLRSPDTNSVYYNPEVRYLPWAKADSTRMFSSTPTTARYDPMDSSAGSTDLTSVRTLEGTTLCYYGSNSGCEIPVETVCTRYRNNGTCRDSEERNVQVQFKPMLFYRLQKSGGLYRNPTGETNYTEYDLHDATTVLPTKHPTRTDCAASVCTLTEERKNFANWFTYYRTRMLLAKGAVAEAFVGSTDAYRFGYGRINRTTAQTIDNVSTRTIISGVRDFNDTQRNALYDWLFGLDAVGGTPLRRAMQDVGNYFSRTDNRGPWGEVPGTNDSTDHKSCRRAYHILVTDGYWSDSVGSDGLTSVGNQDNEVGTRIVGPGRDYTYDRPRPYRDGNDNTLADYAMKFWKNDLRTDLDNKVVPSADNPAFWQHMVNFTVGLGVRGTLNPDVDLPGLSSDPPTKSWGNDKIDDLWHAALNSRGSFFSAKDPSELSTAIRTSLGQAVERELREAGVATAATVLEEGNRKYVPYYRTGSWRGDVNALVLDSQGQAGATVWSADSRMPAWNNRAIYTWDRPLLGSPRAVSFTWAAMSEANRTALGGTGSVAITYTSTFVDFLRGEATRESVDASAPFRQRAGRLGDIVNSTPVFVQGSFDGGYVNLPTIGASYGAFLAAKKARIGALFIGANDGMLHAFRDSKSGAADDGREVFAYVPRAVYPSLSKLASKTYGTDVNYHQYFVDGPLRESDAFVHAPGAGAPSWRNYLVGSTGVGARAVFALDVTDTPNLNASAIKWEISDQDDSDLGYITSPIEVGVLPNGRWVAVFGNGTFSGAGRASLFVVTLENGAIQKLAVDIGGANGLGGVTAKRNANGQIVALYAGDLKGKLWKFEYDAAAASGFKIGNNLAPLFAATSTAGAVAQPITQPPVLYDHSRGGGPLVVFGTGLLQSTADANSTTTQSMYGYWDKSSDSLPHAARTRSTLVERTITSFAGAGGATFYDIAGPTIDWDTKSGWAIDLTPSAGLRVVYPPQAVSSKLVLFSTVAPARNVVACETASGQGVNFIFPVETGETADYPLFDTNGDGIYGPTDTVAAGYASGADGIDAVVRGATQCTEGICYTKFSIQNTTGQLMVQGQESDPNFGGARTIRDRSWRRIINPPIR